MAKQNQRLAVATCAGVMAAAATWLASGSAEAFALKHTSHGQPLHWEAPSVTFVVDPSVAVAVPGGADAVTRAVDAWSGMSGAPVLVTQAGPGGAEPQMDRQNSVLLAPQGFVPAGNALAVTVVSLDDATGAILDTDVVVNGIHSFAVLSAQAQGSGRPVATDGAGHGQAGEGSFDLEHVVAHEIGHAMGLADEDSDHSAVMYAFSRSGDASNRAPASDDLAGIEMLYGGTKAHGGCGSASVAGVNPRQDGTWAVVVFALGAGAWLASRRRARWLVPASVALFGLLASPDASSALPGSDVTKGDAAVRVVAVSARDVGGLLETTLDVTPELCRRSACPLLARAHAWGGTKAGITQTVGGRPAPRVGDLLEVVFLAPPAGGMADASVVRRLP